MIALSARAEMLSQKTMITPQLILEIDGLPVFGALKVLKMVKLGDLGTYLGMPGLRLGRPSSDPDAENLINLAGSTSTITQQLFQDKGLASSIASIGIELVDKDGLLTKILSPGIVLTDLLTQKARVYLNFGEGAHPEDSVPILYGVVDVIDAGAGYVKLNIAHPDGLKRQDIFTKIQSTSVERLRFRSRRVQGIDYQTQDQVSGGLVTVRLASGGTAGAETVSVVNRDIVVYIQPGVSKASQVANAIKDSQAAVNLVHVEVTEGNDGLGQTAVSAFTLDSSTSLLLDSTEGMLLPTIDGTVETYVRIADEVIKYTDISGNLLTGIEGAQFGTIGTTYEADENVETFYRIKGTMKDVALKLMLSRGRPVGDVKVRNFLFIDSITSIPNGIVFQGIDVEEKYGITVGDLISTVYASESANNVTDRPIVSIQKVPFGSYIVIDNTATLVEEINSSAEISFKSKYDVWPDGLGMQIDQVDVGQHEELEDYFPSGFFEYDFYIKDTIRGDEFIAKEVYFPSGCYTLPREGRASVGITLPPLAKGNTVFLDETNVVNPAALKISRSINNNFYNSIVYKFEEDAVEDKFERGIVTLSANSLARVKNVKNKPLLIEAKGIRDVGDNRQKIETQVRRFLDRFEFGAEMIDVEVLYKVGFRIEVGDTVVFGSPDLQIADSSSGTRKFRPRIMEVKNKKMDIRNGRITLTLLNTAFATDANYGVVSPSSIVDSGSTDTRLKLQTSITTPSFEFEKYKWEPYIGQKILLHSVDWIYSEETTIVEFLTSSPDTLVVSPALSAAPPLGTIIDIPAYPDSVDVEENELYKLMHCFFSPQVAVVSGVSPSEIEVSPADIGKFYIGSPVRIHTAAYFEDSDPLSIAVTEIIGNNIRLSRPHGLIVDSTYLIDLIGFPDKRGPYRLI